MKAAARQPLQEVTRGRRTPLTRRDWIFILAGWILSSLLLMAIDQGRLIISRDKVLKYKAGDFVEEDFVLDSEFSFIDEESTAKVVALNRSLVPPVYEVQSGITESVLDRFDRFSSYIEPALTNRLSGESADILRSEFPGAAGLLDKETSRSPTEFDQILKITRDALQTLQLGGIFRLQTQDGGAASGIIEVVYPDQLPERRVTLIRNAVPVPENLVERTRSLDQVSELSPDEVELVAALVLYFAEPNGYLNEVLTERNMDDAEAGTEPVKVVVPEGTRLLSEGAVVTARQAAVLEALKGQRALGYHGFVDPPIYMAVIFALGLVAAGNFGIRLHNSKTLWLFVALGGTYILVAALLAAYVRFSGDMTISVLMPTALFTLLLAQLLQDRKTAVLISVLMALLIFFLTGENSHDFLITLTAGIGGTLSVKRRETRMGLLRAGPRLAVGMAVVIFLTGILVGQSARTSLAISAIGAANGLITGILSLAFLPLLEHVLNTATTFRLIELSDQNVPILKRMRLQAPGTYIHSQNVAHLAEAACDAIGAYGLLARVGAYYHDIGKVDQSHFFVENQSGENKHDDLKASLSVAVIKSHVKIGMEKGRELRLPDEVLAVIEQHHGTSVIRYFYDRALKQKDGESVSPEDFSYAGPKPMSREAAVVMLADSAEAATRTLKKPTAAKLEKYVWDLIMERFRTGELNDCDLTLRDLETVKETFVQVLTGHFHSRIEYPKDEAASK
jgi:putative nucleotidyltransferase with HDIG domain